MTGNNKSREGLLVKSLVQLADTLVADFDVVELLTLLTDCCVGVLGVTAAGLMLTGPDRQLRVVASSSETMRVLELFELQAEEGPCLDAFTRGIAVMHPDLVSSGTPWPRFALEAASAGFRSVHAVPMKLRGAVIGALNLLRVQTGELPEADVDAAQALADIATIAILQHRATVESQVLNQQLQHALNSRIVIEQAKGMVSERSGLDMPASFAALRSYARDRNLRLADVAESVISGRLETASLQNPQTSELSAPKRGPKPRADK